jgi:hypothetical protein
VVAIMEAAYGTALKSAVDVGCATGDLVQGFLDLGLDAWGIEGSPAAAPYLACPPERVAFHDLREPMPDGGFRTSGDNPLSLIRTMPTVFDVVTCFEVAEHLEPEAAPQFVDTLVSLSDHLVISACPPDPRGRPATKYHLNEQPREYWEELFAARGFRRNGTVEQHFLNAWHPWRKKYGIAAFHMNLIYFERV